MPDTPPETTPELPELMTVKETSEYLRIPIPTVYYLVSRGQLPGVQIGGRWRLKRSLIDRNILKKESARCLAVSLRFADEAIGRLVQKQLSSSGMGVIINNSTPDTIITDDASVIKDEFSGRIIAITADTQADLIAAQTRQGSPVTLATSLQIADPATLRSLLGLAA